MFYVKDVFGLKVEDKAKLEQIEQRLLQAIAAPEEPPQPALEAAARVILVVGSDAAAG